MRHPAGPVPTLRQLHAHACWLWLDCPRCGSRRPALIVHLMIALGVDASSNRVRETAVCRCCRHRGASTTLPSHVDSITGTAPWPGEHAGWSGDQLLRGASSDSSSARSSGARPSASRS